MSKSQTYISLPLQIIRYSSVLLIVLLVARFRKISNKISNILTNLISADNELHIYTVFNIKAALVLLMLFLFALFLLTFPTVSKKTIKFFYRFFDLSKVKSFFLKDALIPDNKLTPIILTASLFIGSGIHFFLLFSGEPKKEGWLENITTALFLIAAIFSLVAFFQIRKYENLIGATGKSVQIILVIFSAAMVVIFGEEISWGQHMFQWDAEGVFEDKNFQSETNIHNFFNPLFKYAYPIFGICFFIVIFLFWFFPKNSTTNKSFYTQLLIPHPSLFYLVLLMTGASIIAIHETFESLFAFFVFFYSLRIYYSTQKKLILKRAGVRESVNTKKK